MKPYPHDMIIGGKDETYHQMGGWEATYWACRFEFEGGGWACVWRLGPEDEAPEIPELTGHGISPKGAFESLIRIWTFSNGGEESKALRNLMQAGLREYFTDEGGLKSPELLNDLLKRRSIPR